jgi:hypothetical protein
MPNTLKASSISPNPLTVSVYPEEKTRRLVMLHAWWPGGQIIGGRDRAKVRAQSKRADNYVKQCPHAIVLMLLEGSAFRLAQCSRIAGTRI